MQVFSFLYGMMMLALLNPCGLLKNEIRHGFNFDPKISDLITSI